MKSTCSIETILAKESPLQDRVKEAVMHWVDTASADGQEVAARAVMCIMALQFYSLSGLPCKEEVCNLAL